MCEYCEKEKDLARIDLDDEDETFAHVYIIDNQLRLCTESEYFDDEVIILANYCPMCGRKLETTNVMAPSAGGKRLVDYLNNAGG